MEENPFDAPAPIVKDELGIPNVFAGDLAIRADGLQGYIPLKGVLVKGFANFGFRGYESD
jgi:hypothetical protein